jgi:arginyl-tRNA synthetase
MDGTTLYISRDVAGALDRYERFKFDKMLYVVDTGQRGHFVALIRILELMEAECASKIEYVPFGRVNGMSTRKGEAVWLDDILKEAKHKMQQKQIESLSMLLRRNILVY